MNKKLILNTVKSEIVDVTDADMVALCLSTNVDTDAVMVKKEGDAVKAGEVIAKCSDDLLSVSLHAPINGKVSEVNINTSKLKKQVSYVAIKKDSSKSKLVTLPKLNSLDRCEIKKRIQQAGIVGCGGAGYPAYAKIKADVTYTSLIINACVSDYLTCADLAVLYHNFNDVLKGITLLKDSLDIKKAYIVVNKFCKQLLNEDIEKAKEFGVDFYFMPNRYGQGDEKIICKRLFGYNKEDGFPAYAGMLVYNAQTVYQIKRSVYDGENVTSRVITICGKLVNEAKNYRVLIGANVEDIITKQSILKCSYKEYEEREKATVERFLHLQELRKQLPDKKQDKEFLSKFVEERKDTNSIIFNFLKYEKINKMFVSCALLVGGRRYGKIYDGNVLNIQKNTYCIEYLNEKQFNKLNKKFKNNFKNIK